MLSRKDAFIASRKHQLTNQEISRRSFIQSMVAAGVLVPTAIGMADQAMAATPKSGGKFIMGMAHGSTTDTINPLTYENGFSLVMAYLWGNSLTEVAPNGELVGDLAESFESDDAKTWRFKLRQGVEFHNGKTLTPEDVIATINLHRGEESTSAAKGVVAPIQDMAADGDTVVFTLETPNADFPYLMSDYHLVIMPSVDGTVDTLAGIGTGGFKVDNYEPGVRLSTSRNANYHKPAYFDEVEVLSLIDPTARQNALLSGDVHAIDRIDPKTVNLLGRAPNVNILEKTGTLHYTFPMRVDAAPFDNYDLRMALKLSIPRQELVDKILLGHGAIGNDHPISTANPYHAADIPQREFDADLARHHYEKSGHSGPIQLSASDAAFAGAVDAAQLIAASAAEAGIEIEVVREPSDGYWSNVWNKKPWCACYWGGRPTEDWMFASAYVAETEWNDTAWRTTESALRFNEVVAEARAELDPAKRRTQYAEAQTLIHDDGGAIVPMFANYIMGLSNEVAHGDDVAANWTMDGSKAGERWWFA
ncbi:ABC transporter substrate-binding protein [Halocynthiibacter styelae]|uniref:ABC transporter substrate-binding protein n=1 Tax=Halocynthiibacter styelae TaxID=2761955 RepID=A0A8J7IQH6_9RHOB|nr:ABC transporter substrate-binding protein [Paenihalocynthiibacter styelae]MBI1495256.1 ABC transporter substrate-binding protein [Paenihalocynthiibacter styelae]